ncbi:MAG: beta-galactosidase [Silvanigrellales bacterium]|nr:beta-galactosidase [Silvanigrellales bacterium]
MASFPPFPSRSNPMPHSTQPLRPPARNRLFELGAAYYPDYVPASALARRADGRLAVLSANERIREDFLRMRKQGLHIIRMGEFSWSAVEPKRGQFHTERFDLALDLAHEFDIRVLFCTPTATPPKWLVDAHPDILPFTRAGTRVPFGGRRHYDVHSATYRAESARITAAYAQAWGRHPAVVGWQTDNEFGCHGSVFLFSDAARDAFRAWLKERYFGNIENLNAHWFTSFWSQRYTEFTQVELPWSTWTDQNPHLELDFRRFSNEAWRGFQEIQVRILREHSPGRFLTHNFMTNFTDLCPWTLSEDLDVAGFDHYQMEPVPHPLTSHHDFALMASLRKRRFWVLEQQPLQVNWQTTNRRFAYSWLFLWGVQSSFLGARGMLAFSWQRMAGGAEQYHDGLVAHDVRVGESPQEKIVRAKNLFFSHLEERFGLSELPRQEEDVLCIHGMESLWTHEITSQSQEYSTRKQLDWVSALCTRLGWGLHFTPSVESARQDLTRYRIIILPGYAFEFTTLEKEALRRFVDSGGVVLSLPRTAMKLKNNQMSPLPLCLFDEDDFHFEDHGALLEGEREACVATSGSFRFEGHLWAERIAIHEPEISQWQTLARFEGGLYAGAPAALRNASFHRKGAWVHMATCPLASDGLFQWLAGALGVAPRVARHEPEERPFAPGPQPSHATAMQATLQGRVQVVPLALGARRFLGLVNFGDEDARVTLAESMVAHTCLWASIDETNFDLRLKASLWSTPEDTQSAAASARSILVAPRGVGLVEVQGPLIPSGESTQTTKLVTKKVAKKASRQTK